MLRNIMPHFTRIINASAIIILLLGLVGYFSSTGNNRIFSFQPDAQAEPFRASDISKKEQRSQAPAPMPLTSGAYIRPMDAATFDTIIEDSRTRPVFIMIYASWCPHCKRMFKELNKLQKDYIDKIRVVALSIDNNSKLAQNFANTINDMQLEPYIIANGASYFAIGESLRSFGLSFQGGISKSVGVPYNIVFYQGSPVAELGGALPSANLNALFKDISENAK